MGQADRRKFLIAVGGLLAVPLAYAQPRIRRLAVVAVGDMKRQPLASLVHGLRELGYEEGRNLELLPPAAEGGYPALAELAARAVKREAEVIVTYGSTATRAAKAATWTLPIVMVVGVDPVEQGFVRTYARPEGNITGIAISSHILSVKRIELLKEVLPKIQRFGVLWSAESASQRITLEHMRAAAARLGLELHAVEVSNVGALEGAFEKLSEGRVEALIPIASAWLVRETAQLVRLVSAHRIPAIYGNDIAVQAGGLMSMR